MEFVILAKYGEMALKGLNRFVFEKAAIKNIRERLGKGYKIRHMQSTIYITGEDIDGAYEKMKTVFGVASLCKAVICEKNFEDIQKKAVEYFSDILPYKRTFKVSAKRADKRFPLRTPEICRELGHTLLEAFPNLHVDCENPDIEVRVDIRDENAFIYGEKIQGAGGLPVGTGGKALLLLSGGIDSPVAGYLLAKRGVKLTALYFETPPYTSERAKLKAIQLANQMENYCGKIEFISMNITQKSEDFKNHCAPDYFTLLLRREMVRIANSVCREKKLSAIITGESLGQVASQTIESIACTDNAAEFPVLRPLIGFDKREIVAIARKIGTMEISEQPFEDCCTVFTPKHPVTHPKISEILAEEESLLKLSHN